MQPTQAPPPYSAYDNQKPLQDAYSYGYPNVPPTSAHGQPLPPQASYVPQQQQQQVVVVASPAAVAPHVVYNPYPVPMTGAVILSCIVFWCFGWIFGGIAFILAVMGSDASNRGNVGSALRLRNASYGMSVVGIVVGVIVIAIVIWLYSSCSNSNPYRNQYCW